MHRFRPFATVSLCALAGLCAAAPAQASHAYVSVCCTVPSSISVVSRATHNVTGTLIAGEGAAFVVLTPDGQTAYVANENGPSIYAIDTATGVPTAEISLAAYDEYPYAAVLSPDGSTLYVLATVISLGIQTGFIDLLALDTTTGALLFNDPIPGTPDGATDPEHLPPPAISADGQTIYIAGYEFIVFNAATQTVTATVATPPGYAGPEGLAVTPDDAYAIVTGNGIINGNGELTLVDLKTLAIVKQIGYGRDGFIGPVVCSPDGLLAYFVLNQNTSHQVQVLAFDIASRQVVNTFSAGSGLGQAIAITPDGSEIEVGNSYNATVTALNAASGAVIATVATLGQLVSIAVSADGQSIYVPNFESSMVEVIDPSTTEITGQIPAGAIDAIFDKPYTLRVSADGARAVVTGTASLTVIDAAGQQLIGVVSMPGVLNDVALASHGNPAYVAMAAPAGGTAQILAVDTAALTVSGTMNLTSADRPVSAALSPDGSTLYITDENCPAGGRCVQQVSEIDTATLQIAGRIPLSASSELPGQIVVTTDGATAYVANPISASKGVISVVDLAQAVVAATIPLEYIPGGIALAPDQQTLYVLDGFITPGGILAGGYIIDLQQLAITGAFPGGPRYPSQIAVGPSSELVYVTNATRGEMEVFTAPPNRPPHKSGIALPGPSGGVGFSPRY